MKTLDREAVTNWAMRVILFAMVVGWTVLLALVIAAAPWFAAPPALILYLALMVLLLPILRNPGL